MNVRSFVETAYRQQTDAFASSKIFQDLEAGNCGRETYDEFLAYVARSHMQSPKIVAFIYAISPPAATERLKHNLLEELGLEEAEESHPDLLIDVLKGAGFDDATLTRLDAEAQEELRRKCADPFMYGTIMEFGLHTMLEVFSFEWMLSRLASRIADFLARHRGIARDKLLWFDFHSEKDIQHAEEALDTLADYLAYYDISNETLQAVADVCFRENVFARRYFGASVIA